MNLRDSLDQCSYSEKNPELTCQACGSGMLLYWCETCQKLAPEKRCPCCGLKTRKSACPAEKY